MTFAQLVGTHVQNVLTWASTQDKHTKAYLFSEMERSQNAIKEYPPAEMTEKDHRILESMTKYLESQDF
jgi:hypothetical protein